MYESRRSKDLKYQDLDDEELGFEDQEEEIPPEEVNEEEITGAQAPGKALTALERALGKEEEEGVTEMRWVWRVAPTQAGVGPRPWGERGVPRPTLCPCGLCVIAVSVGLPPRPGPMQSF